MPYWSSVQDGLMLTKLINETFQFPKGHSFPLEFFVLRLSIDYSRDVIILLHRDGNYQFSFLSYKIIKFILYVISKV